MIHLLIPLLASGVASALWRKHQITKTAHQPLGLRSFIAKKTSLNASTNAVETQFDDVGELHHYQSTAWYGLALAASGSFYPPVTLASIPLLGYNAYHFTRLLKNTDATGRKSPMAVFESITLAVTLATGQYITTSVMFLLSFGSRKLFLQAGNIAAVGFSRSVDPRFAKVWILREGVELESLLRETQVNDVIVVRAGDTILLEGRVIKGEGVIRQYSLQKKSKLINKQESDSVFPFTQLESGCLYIKKTK